MFKHLYQVAERLHRLQNTEYSEAFADTWDRFEELLNKFYNEGKITGKQFNDLVLLAFFFFFGEFKPEN